MTKQRLAIGLLIAGTAAIAGIYFGTDDGPEINPGSAAGASPHLPLNASQVVDSTRSAPPSTPGLVLQPPAQPPSGIQPRESRQQRLSRQLGSNNPAERMSAYRELAMCVLQQKTTPTMANDSPGDAGNLYLQMNQVCDGVTSEMLSKRHKVIEDLAKSGHPGAAAMYIEEAPDGTPLALASKDPNYQSWYQAALKQLETAARSGDYLAAESAGLMLIDKPGSEYSGLELRVATLEAGKRLFPSMLPMIEGQITSISQAITERKVLSPQQIQQAIASGRALGKAVIIPKR